MHLKLVTLSLRCPLHPMSSKCRGDWSIRIHFIIRNKTHDDNRHQHIQGAAYGKCSGDTNWQISLRVLDLCGWGISKKDFKVQSSSSHIPINLKNEITMRTSRKEEKQKPMHTSSAVLATESNPIYAKKTVADPASIPSTPKGKYLINQRNKCN